MAQALEQLNVSQNPGKMFSFAQKTVILFRYCFWRIPVSSKVFDQKKKAIPYHFTTSVFATNPNNILLLIQAVAEQAARSAELPRSSGTGKMN